MKTIELFQWDLDKSIPAPYPEVHFASLGDEQALVVMSQGGNASIPNILLQEPKDINVWFMRDGAVVDSGRIRVITRPKPSDYAYTETEIVRVEKLVSDIKALKTDMATLKEDMSNLQVGAIPPATVNSLGGIKVGSNLSITPDGTLSATVSGGGGATPAPDVWERVYTQMATPDKPMRIVTVTQNESGEPLSVYKKLLVTRDSSGKINGDWYATFKLNDKNGISAGSNIGYIVSAFDTCQIYTLSESEEILEMIDMYHTKDKVTSSNLDSSKYYKRVKNYQIEPSEDVPFTFRQVQIVANLGNNGPTNFIDAQPYTRLHVWGVRK